MTYISEGNDAWLGEVLQDPVVLGYQATDAMYKSLVLGEELIGRSEALNLHADRLDQPLQRVAHGLVIIDHKNDGLC